MTITEMLFEDIQRRWMTLCEAEENGAVFVDNDGNVKPSPVESHDILHFADEFSGICIERNAKSTMIVLLWPNEQCIQTGLQLLQDCPAPFTVITPKNRRGKKVASLDALRRVFASNPTFYYHACLSPDLPSIRQHGLQPSKGGSNWAEIADDSDLDEWSVGKVMFSPTPEQAKSYVLDKIDFGAKGKPVILRVSSQVLGKPHQDIMGRGGDVYVEHAIPPEQIEILVGRTWKPLNTL